MKNIAFVRLESTVFQSPNEKNYYEIDNIDFVPHVLSSLKKLSNNFNILFYSSSPAGNQSQDVIRFWKFQKFFQKIMVSEHIRVLRTALIDDFSSFHRPNDTAEELKRNINLSEGHCVLISGSTSDYSVAKEMGISYIYLKTTDLNPSFPEEIASFQSWNAIVHNLLFNQRKGQVHRKTNETDICIELNLDGNGNSHIHTGLHFFDHMLEQIPRHANIDLDVKVKGDLHVDEHHTIEDTAIALGEAFLKALGNKRSIERYGFLLPMDDCLAQIGIDFGGRNWLVWDVKFSREKIGDCPTEMFFHFFKSFTDTAKCNLNIKAEGENEHHKIESIFKGFAKAIKQAITRDEENLKLPTTKGVL